MRRYNTRVNYYDLPEHLFHLDKIPYYSRYFNYDENRLINYWSNRNKWLKVIYFPEYDYEDGYERYLNSDFWDIFYKEYGYYKEDDSNYQRYVMNEDLVKMQRHFEDFLKYSLDYFYYEFDWRKAVGFEEDYEEDSSSSSSFSSSEDEDSGYESNI